MHLGAVKTTSVAASLPDDRAYSCVLGVSIRNSCLAGVSPLVELKVEGRKVSGTTIRHDVEPC